MLDPGGGEKVDIVIFIYYNAQQTCAIVTLSLATCTVSVDSLLEGLHQSYAVAAVEIDLD